MNGNGDCRMQVEVSGRNQGRPIMDGGRKEIGKSFGGREVRGPSYFMLC